MVLIDIWVISGMIHSFLYVEQYWKQKRCQAMFYWCKDMILSRENSGEKSFKTHQSSWNEGHIGIYRGTRKCRQEGQAPGAEKGQTGENIERKKDELREQRRNVQTQKIFLYTYLSIGRYLTTRNWQATISMTYTTLVHSVLSQNIISDTTTVQGTHETGVYPKMTGISRYTCQHSESCEYHVLSPFWGQF